MSKWIAEFDLEDGDTMPEHMDLEYKGAKLDFHCRPKEPVLDKVRAEIEKAVWEDVIVSPDGTDEVRIPRLDPDDVFEIIDRYKAESEV